MEPNENKNVKPGEVEQEEITLPGLKESVEKTPVIETPGTEVKKPEEPIKPIVPPAEKLGSDAELPFKKQEEPEKPEVPEGGEGDKKSEEENPFVLEEEEKKPEEPKPGDVPKIDFLELGKELGLEVKDNTPDAFKEAHEQAVEAAKQKVEVDLTKFNDKEKIVIDWLHNGGNLEDFFKPLMAFDSFLAQPDDEKVKEWLINEEGVDKAQVDERLNQIIEEGHFDAYVDKVDQTISGLREQKYNQVMQSIKSTNDAYQASVQQTAIKERGELKTVLDQTKEFMGIPIPDNVKDILKREIDGGQFTKKNDNAQTQMKARLFDLFGDKVLAKVNKDWQTKVDEAYNRGVKGMQNRLHNIPVKPEEQPGHGGSRTPQEQGKLADMSNIDKDAKQVW